MRRLCVVLLLVTACGSKKSDDKCARVMDKSMTVLNEIAALRGVKLGAKEKQQLIEQCKKAEKAGHPDPATACVLAAADDKAVRNCYMKSFEDHLQHTKEIEAKLQLTKIGKAAKAYVAANKELPKGKVGPTPATPCCSEQIKQCIPAEGTWADPVWHALEFSIDGPYNFQYSYESDGKTFTATATGDIECAGKPTTTTLTGTIGADGQVTLSKL